jgi:hypothetical protein
MAQMTPSCSAILYRSGEIPIAPAGNLPCNRIVKAMRSFNLAEAVHKIPGALEDMLVRGAYLEHCASELEQSRREQELRLQAVRASQPPFLFLRPKETRIAFQAAAQDTSADLTVIDQALVVNKRLCDHLRACSEEMLEKWLSTHCEEYQLGLASGHFAVDWEHALERCAEAAQAFLVAAGTARNMASAGYDHTRGRFSPATCEAINIAHAAAMKVEASIAAVNAVAMAHSKFLDKTVFRDPMPRLVLEPYTAVVAKIADMSALAAHGEFNRVIVAVEDLLHREMGGLRTRMREAIQQHAERMKSYVRNAWNQLHAHAVAHSVDAENISAVVEQTERAYINVISPVTASA